MIDNKQKITYLFFKKIRHLSLYKLAFLLVLFSAMGLVIFGVFRLEPHYLSSKEAFLGNFYRGKIISFIRDNEKAKTYLTKAIEKYNSAEAECDLGEIYEEKGNHKLEALNYLGAAMYGSQRCEVYFLRLSFPDEKKTFLFLKKMADEKMYPSAYFMVGVRLIEGRGIVKDTKVGIAYLEKAVAKNHWGAKLYLAGIYIKGELLPQDIDKANELMGVNKSGEK